jgi:hypothetical protein
MYFCIVFIYCYLRSFCRRKSGKITIGGVGVRGILAVFWREWTSKRVLRGRWPPENFLRSELERGRGRPRYSRPGGRRYSPSAFAPTKNIVRSRGLILRRLKRLNSMQGERVRKLQRNLSAMAGRVQGILSSVPRRRRDCVPCRSGRFGDSTWAGRPARVQRRTDTGTIRHE